MKKYIAKKYSKGNAVMISVLFFLIISSTLISGITIPTANRIKTTKEAIKARQSYLAADSANDDALYRLNQGWSLPASFEMPFSFGVTSVASVSTDNGNIVVRAVGDAGIPARSSKSVFSVGTGATFAYVSQVGIGGLEIGGGSTITGNVYSNGDIIMTSGGATINGSVTVSNELDPELNQSNFSENSSGVIFGKTSSQQDVAQGFSVTSSTNVSYIRVSLKKNNNPGNITIRLTTDNGGKPSGTTLFSSTISSNAVTSSYKYFVIPLTSVVNLTPGNTYWIVLDYGSNHNSKYYTAEASTGNNYIYGVSKIGSWSSSSGGTWSDVSPLGTDLFFDIFLGGTVRKIEGQDQYNRINVTGGGNVWSYEVNNVTVSGSLYCQFGTNVYNFSGKTQNCINQVSAVPIDFPISDNDINEWKSVIDDKVNSFSGGWVYNGNLTIGWQGTTTSSLKKVNGNLTVNGGGEAYFGELEVVGDITVNGGGKMYSDILKVGGNISAQSLVSLGTAKVSGNLTVTNGANLYFKENIWVKGSLTNTGGGDIILDSSVIDQNKFVIVDGRIEATGGSQFINSASGSAYVIAISTIDCPGSCSGGSEAIKLTGGSGAIVFFAPYGTLDISGGASLRQATAEKIKITGGSNITYDSSLVDIDLDTGPSSSVVVESWEEVGQ